MTNFGKQTLSAVIITKDEEDHIEDCLKSILWVDEIIVIDDHSCDKTLEICGKYTSNIYKNKFISFSEQRNFGSSKSSCDWILSIDADERIGEKLKNKIQEAVKNNEKDIFFIAHKNLFLGKWMRHGGWYPDWHIRLFRNKELLWCGVTHEKVASNVRAGKIYQPILHLSHRNICDQVRKSNFYSSIEAQKFNKDKFSNADLIFKPTWVFFNRFFLRFGFLDGIAGIIFNILVSYYIFLGEAKKWEAIRKNEDNRN